MGAFNVHKHKQAKRALKSMKAIGRGGVSRDFLQNVHLVRTPAIGGRMSFESNQRIH